MRSRSQNPPPCRTKRDKDRAPVVLALDKTGGHGGRRLGTQAYSGSEPELWTEADAHVVVDSVVEEDVVTDFRADTDGAGKALDTSAGIHREVRCSASQTHCRLESGWGTLVRYGEILEAYFAGHEDPERTRARLEFRTKQSVQRAKSALHRSRGDAIAEGAGVVSLEVVAHFPFDLDAGADIECRSSAKADVVAGGSGVTEAEIFGKDADFRVI